MRESEGTLAKLKYQHIKGEYEAERTPIHIHVEAEITKGKYHQYDTFIHWSRSCTMFTHKRGYRNILLEQIFYESPLIRYVGT